MTAERFEVKRCCFVTCGYRETAIFLHFRKWNLLAENELEFTISLTSDIIATYLLNVTRWIDKKLMHDKNLNN